MEGHVTLARRFFDHHFWSEERPYSRAEAWLDMIQTAAFAAHKRLINGSVVEIPRGGIVATERFFSDRWKWSRTKVRSYLDLLEAERMIRRKKDQGNAVVFLCNFDLYNQTKGQEKAKKEPPEDQARTKVEEGKEGENGSTGREAADDPTANDAEMPNEKRFVAMCARFSVPEWFAQEKFIWWDGKEWMSGQSKFNWKKVPKIVAQDYVNNGRPVKVAAGTPTPLAPAPAQPEEWRDWLSMQKDEHKGPPWSNFATAPDYFKASFGRWQKAGSPVNKEEFAAWALKHG